jgi:PKD repeat protein
MCKLRSLLLSTLTTAAMLSCEIQVPPKPVASFTVANNNCTVPCEVTFANNSQHAESYLWDFGDGTSSTEMSPTKTFTTATNRQVKLIARGTGGSSGSTQLLSFGSTSATVPIKVWDKTLGGNGEDSDNKIINTTDGGFLIVGSSKSGVSGDKSQAGRGGVDYWIVKTDGSGKKLWDRTFGGSADDIPQDAVNTQDGGYLIVGHSSSNQSVDKSENSKGAFDYWAIRLDANGNKVWDKTIGGGSFEMDPSVVAAADGGFVIAGWSESNISGDKTENSRGDHDYWIVKLNSSGTKVWDRTFGGSVSDNARAIINTPDGGFLVAGSSNSPLSGDKSESSRGLADYWILKLNASGAKLWDKTFGGDEFDYAMCLVNTSDGGTVIAGHTASGISGNKTENRRGSIDFWMIKITANGSLIWDKTIGASAVEEARAIVSTSDGGVVVVGSSESSNTGDKTEVNKNYYDYWVVKLNSSGSKVWDKALGGNGFDKATSAVSTSDGGLVISGSSFTGVSEDKSEPTRGDSDYWIIKIK